MAFHFACYGAGTPEKDDFDRLKHQGLAKTIGPFTAELPQKLLRQGALAVVGHVERAWGHSFFWPGAGKQTAVFESALQRMLSGATLGSAMEYFNQRYAELSTVVSSEIDNARAFPKMVLDDLVEWWTAHNDARNYIVLGDPAARLPVAAPEQPPVARPAIEKITVNIPPREKTTSAKTTETEPTTSAKPLDRISDADWDNTPPTVQAILRELVAMNRQLKARFDQLEQGDIS
jgi:hypothetical protein